MGERGLIVIKMDKLSDNRVEAYKKVGSTAIFKLESVRKRLPILKDDPSLKTRYMVSGEGIFVKF